MAFMLPALGGLLGSMLFKEDGGKIGTPALKSTRLAKMTSGKWPSGIPKIADPKNRKSGGKVKKRKNKKK